MLFFFFSSFFINFESELGFEFQLYGVIFVFIVMQLNKNLRFGDDYYRAKDLKLFQRNIDLITLVDGLENHGHFSSLIFSFIKCI